MCAASSGAVACDGDVAHGVPDKPRDAVVTPEDPDPAPGRGGPQLIAHVSRRATDARIGRVDAVLDEEQVRPMRALVLRTMKGRAGPPAIGALPADDRGYRGHRHRALLRLAELRVARRAIEERPQGHRAHRRIASFEEPGEWVVAQEGPPAHLCPSDGQL